MSETQARLAGRRIVVTGAARGIGAAIARRAAEEGARVIVADVDGAAAAADGMCTDGLDAEPVQLDVTDAAQVREVIGRGPPLHGLVCNAGVSGRMPLADITVEHFDRVLAVNLRGALLCCQAAVPLLSEEGGSIVGICSSSAHQGVATHSVYAASKGGLLAMFRSLAVELAPRIRVNTVSPGVVPTDLNAARLSDPEQVRLSRARAPLGRLGSTEDVAAATAFLLSNEASFVTGTDLRVDGGETAN